jgi:hypothetical protein
VTKSASPTETPPEVIDDVGLRGRLKERPFQVLALVAHDAEVDDVHVQPAQHAVQGVAVAVVDLPRAERLADRGEFVAGREERHARPAPHAYLADAERGDEAEMRRAAAACRRPARSRPP